MVDIQICKFQVAFEQDLLSCNAHQNYFAHTTIFGRRLHGHSIPANKHLARLTYNHFKSYFNNFEVNRTTVHYLLFMTIFEQFSIHIRIMLKYDLCEESMGSNRLSRTIKANRKLN